MYFSGLQSGAAGRPAGFLRRLGLLLLLAFLAYETAYFLHPYVPHRDFQGWFLSWDQSMYRRAALNLTHWYFDNATTYYPPVFPWLGAPFVRWWPEHTYFVPSFVCLAIHLAGLAVIGERYFGRVLTYGVVAVMFLAFPKLTLDQFAIPWTSSGVAALSSVLILLFDRDRLTRPIIAAFFLAYGAVFATRPLDVVPLFPLALAMAWRALLPLRPETLRLIPLIGVCGLAFPALYLGLNWHAEGNPFGGYIHVASQYGFTADPQHFLSIWLALQAYFPLFIPAVALCIVALFRAPATIRLTAAAVLATLIGYACYADVTTENLFPVNLVHYFKWAMPWLALIAAGQASEWIRPRVAQRAYG